MSEVARLKVPDIESGRMTLRVEPGQGQSERYVMLSPQLLQLFARVVACGGTAGLALCRPEPDQSCD